MMTFPINLTMDDGAVTTLAFVAENHGYARKGLIELTIECYLDQNAFDAGLAPMRIHHLTMSIMPAAAQMAAVNAVLLPLVQAQFEAETAPPEA